MKNSTFIKLFKFCPICTAKLHNNPLYPEAGAVFCPDHGDFLVYLARGANQQVILFRPYAERTRITQSYRKGRPGVRIRCNQTGEIFPTIKAAALALGLDRGNLSAHISGKQKYSHVKGYTFSVVDREV